MGTSSGLSSGAQARGRGTSSLPGGRFHLAHASRDARDNTAAARGGSISAPCRDGRACCLPALRAGAALDGTDDVVRDPSAVVAALLGLHALAVDVAGV